MLDKLLPPRLKKKPKKLQRQATFLDKPKEQLKKRKYGRDFWELATFLLFVVIYGIYLGQTFENKSKYYISLYLENQLTGGEWHPKKYYGNTVTSEDWLSWASILLVPATFPSENYLGKNFSQIAQQCGSKYSPDCAHAAPGWMADWGAISASRRCDSCPSHDDVGGFILDFEPIHSCRGRRGRQSGRGDGVRCSHRLHDHTRVHTPRETRIPRTGRQDHGRPRP